MSGPGFEQNGGETEESLQARLVERQETLAELRRQERMLVISLQGMGVDVPGEGAGHPLEGAQEHVGAMQQQMQAADTDMNALMEQSQQSLQRLVCGVKLDSYDPLVGSVLVGLKGEIVGVRAKAEQLANTTDTYRHTPNSAVGLRLRAKCAQLMEENREYGLHLNEGRVADLEASIHLQGRYITALRASNQELQEHLGQQDKELERMQLQAEGMQARFARAGKSRDTTAQTLAEMKRRIETTRRKQSTPSGNTGRVVGGEKRALGGSNESTGEGKEGEKRLKIEEVRTEKDGGDPRPRTPMGRGERREKEGDRGSSGDRGQGVKRTDSGGVREDTHRRECVVVEREEGRVRDGREERERDRDGHRHGERERDEHARREKTERNRRDRERDVKDRDDRGRSDRTERDRRDKDEWGRREKGGSSERDILHREKDTWREREDVDGRTREIVSTDHRTRDLSKERYHSDRQMGRDDERRGTREGDRHRHMDRHEREEGEGARVVFRPIGIDSDDVDYNPNGSGHHHRPVPACSPRGSPREPDHPPFWDDRGGSDSYFGPSRGPRGHPDDFFHHGAPPPHGSGFYDDGSERFGPGPGWDGGRSMDSLAPPGERDLPANDLRARLGGRRQSSW